jgi:hypothetical protein
MVAPSKSKGATARYPPAAIGGSIACSGHGRQISCRCCYCQGAEHATQEHRAIDSSPAWSPIIEPDMGALTDQPSLRDWDPMVIEVGLLTSVERELSRPTSPSQQGPGVLSPVLEPVIFLDASANAKTLAHEGTFESATIPLPSDFDARFVNASRQTAPVEMEAGIIPVCPLSFDQTTSAPLPPSLIPSPPLH